MAAERWRRCPRCNAKKPEAEFCTRGGYGRRRCPSCGFRPAHGEGLTAFRARSQPGASTEAARAEAET